MKTNERVLEETIRRCRERNIIIPTFAQQKDPAKIPQAIRERLRNVGLWDVDPANLFRITWKNEPVEHGGGFNDGNWIEFPPELTGVDARIVGLVGKHFPTGAHKVGAAFGCLVPRLVSGQFDPTTQKAVWPSTGNYCRGGAFDCALLGCTAVAILPEEMSDERFEWLRSIGAEVIATPGCESNVKEIYDKCWEIRRTRPDCVIFNQFEEFGNAIWHYHLTGGIIDEIFQRIAEESPLAVEEPRDSSRAVERHSGSAPRGLKPAAPQCGASYSPHSQPVGGGAQSGVHPPVAPPQGGAVGVHPPVVPPQGGTVGCHPPLAHAQGGAVGALRLAAYVSATGSAGTIAAGDFLRTKHPAVRVVATEALQCPTLLMCGFGGHRIEGIGDKHVPWIHNVRNTDMICAIDDERCMQLLRLFNEDAGRALLEREGVGRETVDRLPLLGISSICNLVAAIKAARYYEFGPRDVIFTSLTDSAGMYQSRIAELRQRQSEYSELAAARCFARHLEAVGPDHLRELNYRDRKTLHNFKYFTWVEQQQRDVDELRQLWDQSFWERMWGQVEQWDRLIAEFNERVGLV